ncbi:MULTISPECIES: type II toxin-antitoxin system RelB/DinJ family antitoxin [Butyrivibrio]|uniref:type II toxin-antitoxin system RelB/DinJ family antitoxin n=1 Tax=Butyrivibrio TaxID=830 RepID=UPI00054E53CD|nr:MULTISPECIES: type II toxin-antitoxin system RelB/DinJ family antitoxin [Butyrivibrio]SCY76499.1 DNA-damage-inducible protein J [Butyrivibrio sp. INlla14]
MSATTVKKDTNFNMRMNKQKKASLEKLYEGLGMTLAEAVNIFFEKSLIEGGIPFDVRMPNYNRETIEAFKEAKEIMSGKVKTKSYGSAKELFDELDSE